MTHIKQLQDYLRLPPDTPEDDTLITALSRLKDQELRIEVLSDELDDIVWAHTHGRRTH